MVKRKNCRKCVAETLKGKLCKRSASCRIGCNYYCWQHAEMRSAGKCKEKKVHVCKKCGKKKQKYPCVKKRTVFNKKEEKEEYCKLKRDRPKGPYKRGERQMIAILATEKPSSKRKGKRKVKFK